MFKQRILCHKLENASAAFKLPLCFQMIFCFNFPKAAAKTSIVLLEIVIFAYDPKEAMINPCPPESFIKICQIRGEWVWFRFDSDGTQYDLTCRKISRDTELKRINTNSTIDLDSNENDL